MVDRPKGDNLGNEIGHKQRMRHAKRSREPNKNRAQLSCPVTGKGNSGHTRLPSEACCERMSVAVGETDGHHRGPVDHDVIEVI